ncbi:MAG: DUF3017 domain-containing protein [Actinomycetota bacterium]|nr:DUF3017 domain-containing protein [Actinomycetota bacterium]
MTWLQKPSTTGGIVYLIVMAVLLIGLGTVVFGAWRTGILLMGGSFGLAFAFRAVLPDGRAGMLRVRRRSFDLVVLAVCCTGTIVLATVIPTRV